MSDEPNLSDFLEENAASTTDDSTDEESSSDSSASSAGTDSGLSTYAWGSYHCGACESVVERVWRDDTGLVCDECKQW